MRSQLVSWFFPVPRRTVHLSAINTASASRVEITSAAFRPLAKTQDHSSSVTSKENHGDFDRFMAPDSSRLGNHPPIPVLAPLALRVDSRCLSGASRAFRAAVMPRACHLLCKISENESDVGRDSSRRFPRVESHELKKRVEEGSFKFERACHEHDPPKFFLEPRHMDKLGSCSLTRPSHEPLGSPL